MSGGVRQLVERLNATCRHALEEAAALCVSQTHYNIEVEHLLLKLLQAPGTDIARILRHFDIDSAAAQTEITDAMRAFKRGNSRTPALSPHVPQLLKAAWLEASVGRGDQQVRSGILLLALLEDELLAHQISDSVPLLMSVPVAALRQGLDDIAWGSVETGTGRIGAADDVPGAGAKTAAGAKQAGSRRTGSAKPGGALDQFTIDLTQEARDGRIDPILGRDREIRQIIDILMRRRQNNPILTGEAGVGKTAVVEGFARRVALGDVPPVLQGTSVLTLDVGLLQAGAGVKGEFEERLKNVIAEAAGAAQPVILFIDEAHSLIGAGGAAGQGDAANLLKPALARGELRTIAATTWTEYKKYIEKDPALARRFQVVKVDEPDEETAVIMLRAISGALEAHHGVPILDEALVAAAKLSARYITGRRLPDKAVSVLDTACARVAIARDGEPEALEMIKRDARAAADELERLGREAVSGRHHGPRMEELEDIIAGLDEKRAGLDGRWREQAKIVKKLTAAEKAGNASDAAALRLELDVLQEAGVLVPARVDADVVAEVVSGQTGIPAGKMLSDEVRAVLDLGRRMAERVVGQPQAVDAIARRIRTARADMDAPEKPTGVFLLVGPSGVGKTETAVTLADLLYGGERNMVTINMSEYQEAHTVSGLKGAPPGYVGYGTGGVLTEAVRRNPYSVVLLDEVEKAHPDVMEMFYQVFDKGRLEDSEGALVDFRNTVIVLTSNLGADTIVAATGAGIGAAQLAERVRPQLLAHFKPAFLGRLVVVPYLPLDEDRIMEIVRLKLARIQARLWDRHRAELTFDEALAAAIAARSAQSDAGARAIDNILTNTLLPDLSVELLQRMADGTPVATVHVSLAPGGGFDYAFAE